MNLCVALLALAPLIAVMPSAANAAYDIDVTATQPRDIRVLPGESAEIAFVVSNLGPDGADVTLESNFVLDGFDYTFGLLPPYCGELAIVWGALPTTRTYRVGLPALQPGESTVCRFAVHRATTGSMQNDYAFFLGVPSEDEGDVNPANDSDYFAIGSLTDVSLAVVPVSFDIDHDGIAHGVTILSAVNHGPTAVEQFTIQSCQDNYPAEFTIEGDFPGGCGSNGWSWCLDYFGPGFQLPALEVGEKYSCSLRLTSLETYAGRLNWLLYSSGLWNPDTHGSLIDTAPYDNQVMIELAPFADPIFVATFDP